MLSGVLERLIEDQSAIVKRDKGVAFLLAAQKIYQLSDLAYLCVNIPRFSSGSFVHCAFFENSASQAITAKAIEMEHLAEVGIVRSACEQSPSANSTQMISGTSVLRLSSRRGEFAMLAFTQHADFDNTDDAIAPDLAEIKILGEYFHSHMLRRNGIDTTEALVVSARELDCLRWVASGKSAWEASVILGISERTVRFHLNSAREKLNCTTTTQAVAKVVSQQLIAI